MFSGTAFKLRIKSSTDFFARSGLILERVVKVGDVSLMMFGVMNFHRARVDVRFERVVCVGNFGNS